MRHNCLYVYSPGGDFPVIFWSAIKELQQITEKKQSTELINRPRIETILQMELKVSIRSRLFPEKKSEREIGVSNILEAKVHPLTCSSPSRTVLRQRDKPTTIRYDTYLS